MGIERLPRLECLQSESVVSRTAPTRASTCGCCTWVHLCDVLDKVPKTLKGNNSTSGDATELPC